MPSILPCRSLRSWGKKRSSNLIILSKAFVSRAGPLDHYLQMVPLRSHLIPSYKKMAHVLDNCNATSPLGSTISVWACRCAYLSKEPNLTCPGVWKGKIQRMLENILLGFSVLCHPSDRRVNLRWKHSSLSPLGLSAFSLGSWLWGSWPCSLYQPQPMRAVCPGVFMLEGRSELLRLWELSTPERRKPLSC